MDIWNYFGFENGYWMMIWIIKWIIGLKWTWMDDWFDMKWTLVKWIRC